VTRVLAVADEESDLAYGSGFVDMEPDLIVACGDLSFDYLEFLVTTINKPLLYVLGNHDPAPPSRQLQPPVPWVPSAEQEASRPGGCIPLDGRVVEVGGLRVAGLGGSRRYSDGPNQYTERQMGRRSARLALKSRVAARGRTPAIDVLVTHAPPFGAGDGEDVCHTGFRAFHRLLNVTEPRILVHGHIHPYGRSNGDRKIGATAIVNAIAYRLLEISQ
jgi:uncharacterized protein